METSIRDPSSGASREMTRRAVLGFSRRRMKERLGLSGKSGAITVLQKTDPLL